MFARRLNRFSSLSRRCFGSDGSEQVKGGGLLGRVAAASVLGGTACFAALSYRDGPAVTLSRLDHQVRPGLAAMLPAPVFVWLYSASRPLFLYIMAHGGLGSGGGAVDFPHPCTVMGLKFRGDLGNSAGIDKEASLLDFNFELGAGYAVVGTVLNAPHTGNVFPMLGGLFNCNAWVPLPMSGGALNSLGLPGHGVDVAVQKIEDFRRRRGIAPQKPGVELPLNLRFPIGVSIMGHPAQEGQQKLDGVVECVRKAIPVADFIEINESCPNVKHGGDSSGLAERLSAVCNARDEMKGSSGRRVPILVKLGDVGDADATVRLLAKLGVDGIVAVNTQKDYSSFELPVLDRQLLDYYTEQHSGGLSGPPIRERAMGQVKASAEAVRIQKLDGKFSVIHVGGLSSAEDMKLSRASGAHLRQWYTGLIGALAEGECRPRELYPHMTA
ncbi:unnamed protein product [Polarella glacialis]|uniref:Dihydroorotate dehydrogenase catalytic domain-containing protein n=1 Tax=Polarella glacialis TaxID=89957 RepID=A0A813IAV8_POLGL|nr:unnamed protein product [Polarella glacialis]